MTMNQACMLLLALAVAFGSIRLLASVWRSEKLVRPTIWRVFAILSLQLISAVLLYFTLFPPPTYTSAERLVILTANAGDYDKDSQGHVLALPEAQASAGIEAAPDLATALRRYPGVNHVQIIGAGLGPRDQDAARGVSIEFTPAALPKALVELSLPQNVSSGTRWSVQGKVNDITNARIELLDPGNVVVANTLVDNDGHFVLSDTARTAGLAMYQLRIQNEQKNPVETIRLPLNIVQDKPLKVLSLSGGPNPELKYLRRWAVDAGVELQSQINLSPGVQMSNAAISITPASLREVDVLLLDERVWGTMSRGSKQTVIEALRGGMGVLLRITGPLNSNDKSELRSLGFSVADADIVQGVKLNLDGDKKTQPTLNRRPIRVNSTDAVSLLQDDANNSLALWRAEGRGRIGLIWLTDSYQLVLSGKADAHGQIWRDAISKLARARNENAMHLRDPEARINQRTVLCNISAKTYVQDSDAGITYLLPEAGGRNKNCAAFWPRVAGWHLAVSDNAELPFYVRDTDEVPGLKANAIREAAMLLTAKTLSAKNTSRIPLPGSPWPWFSVWLLLTAALWWLERSKLGSK